MWGRRGSAILFALLVTVKLGAEPMPGSGSETTAVFGIVRVAPEDLKAAIREGEAARSAARDVLALPDARFDIVEAGGGAAPWGSLSWTGHPVYSWRFARGTGDRSIPPPAYLLPHEIGHDLFVRHLVPSTKDDQYGGDAPDWLDEMAAIAFEGDELRTVRRRAATRYAREKGLIPLQRFLTMTHPEMEAKSIPASPDGATLAFEAVSDDTPRFYAMASAFYDFLRVRTKGRSIIPEMASVVRRGGSLERWLLDTTGHGGPTGGVASLNEDFLSWIAEDPRYGGAPFR